jgi:hypothetical protein
MRPSLRKFWIVAGLAAPLALSACNSGKVSFPLAGDATVPFPDSVPGMKFYVAPSGDDSSDGLSATNSLLHKPFATPARGLAAAVSFRANEISAGKNPLTPISVFCAKALIFSMPH